VDEAAKVLQYLESEWLCDAQTLSSMSDEAWKEVKLPLGLKEQLRKRFRGSELPSKGEDRALPLGPVFQPQESRTQSPQRRRVTFDSGLQALLDRVKASVAPGNASLKGLARRFKHLDSDKSHDMDFTEFKSAFEELGLRLHDSELHQLWRHADGNDSGRLNFEEFLALFRPKLSARRRSAIRTLFAYLDMNHDGVLQVDDLKLRCDPNAMAEGERHARGARIPSDKVLMGFLENFRRLVGGGVSGEVRYADFERYYEGLSVGIDSDEYFEELLRRAWDLPEGWLRHRLSEEDEELPDGLRPVDRQRLPSYHQHHHPSYLDGARHSTPAQAGSGRTGKRLLRALKRSLAQCCRGDATSLYSDMVIRTYCPIPRHHDAAEVPPPLLPRETFEAVLRRLLPQMDPADLATFGALFQDPVRKDCVDYRAFVQGLQAPVNHARQDCAARVFRTLAEGSPELKLASLAMVPRAIRSIYGERPVLTLRMWLDFHDLVAVAAGDSTDSV
ncbi:CAPS, partial [Symbiodinium sp. KB8]